MAPDRPQPIRNPLRARRSGEHPSCHGVRGRSCPGRDRHGRRFERHLRKQRCRFAAACPAVPSPASLDRDSAVGRVSATSPIYFFFFFAAFLAFLFFAITSLRQKLKKQAQRPFKLQRAIRPSGQTRQRILVSLSVPSDRKFNFHRVTLASSARFLSERQKIFSSIAHNKQSSKKYFAVKPRRPVEQTLFDRRLFY